jgi:hypothetical protein
LLGTNVRSLFDVIVVAIAVVVDTVVVVAVTLTFLQSRAIKDINKVPWEFSGSSKSSNLINVDPFFATLQRRI